jgi:hypothetical protein
MQTFPTFLKMQIAEGIFFRQASDDHGGSDAHPLAAVGFAI